MWRLAGARHRKASAAPDLVAVAVTQDTLYAGLDLDLPWSEGEFPQRHGMKYVHGCTRVLRRHWRTLAQPTLISSDCTLT